MRFSYLLVALIGATVLFLSNTIDTRNIKHSLTIVGAGVPVLPEVPYDYNDFDLEDYLVEVSIPVYYGTNSIIILDTIIFDDNITDAGATLGRVLFYDELLSANENLSCATCHKQEFSFAENTAFSEGVNVATGRNSMHLNDLGWSNNYAFFWDMSQSDLKDMISLPLTNPNEIGLNDMSALIAKMEATDYYGPLFEEAFGNSSITQERIQDALAQFVSSLHTLNSKFDRAHRGETEFTIREEKGETLFRANCATCHWQGTPKTIVEREYPEGIKFKKSSFTNGYWGEEDQGAGVWDDDMRNHFKVPTLRNLKYTAPYLHDGRLETLEEVMDHYAAKFSLTTEEVEALLDFMDTFNDNSFVSEVKWSDPFGIINAVSDPIAGVEEVHIFPNPSNGFTNIVFDNPSAQNVAAYLINMEGRIVRQFSSHKNGFHTDVSQLAAGTYLVRIESGSSFIDKKLIVQ